MDIHRQIVACLGSSSTAGRGQAFDWISELRRRPRNSGINFLNFGAGGDLADNAVQRLSPVIASRPWKVVVWLGANDVLALVSKRARHFYAIAKRPSREPSPESFRASLVRIVTALRHGTSAGVGLCSLAPIGEDLDSTDGFQAELNRRIEEYSATVRSVAIAERCHYIPLHEAIVREMRNFPAKALHEFRFLPLYRDAFRALVLRQTPDEIARRNGWHFHSDGIHLNSRAGLLVADAIQTFIDS